MNWKALQHNTRIVLNIPEETKLNPHDFKPSGTIQTSQVIIQQRLATQTTRLSKMNSITLQLLAIQHFEPASKFLTQKSESKANAFQRINYSLEKQRIPLRIIINSDDNNPYFKRYFNHNNIYYLPSRKFS